MEKHPEADIGNVEELLADVSSALKDIRAAVSRSAVIAGGTAPGGKPVGSDEFVGNGRAIPGIEALACG